LTQPGFRTTERLKLLQELTKQNPQLRIIQAQGQRTPTTLFNGQPLLMGNLRLNSLTQPATVNYHAQTLPDGKTQSAAEQPKNTKIPNKRAPQKNLTFP